MPKRASFGDISSQELSFHLLPADICTLFLVQSSVSHDPRYC